MTLQVNRQISGSSCVIYKHREHYIDVRTSVRSTRYHSAECVRNGQVYRRVDIDLAGDAPEQIVQLVREELL
jgi:hypothetical protein